MGQLAARPMDGAATASARPSPVVQVEDDPGPVRPHGSKEDKGGPPAAPSASPPAASVEVKDWVIADPIERSRRLEQFYDVPDKEMGKGHYGTVRKGMRKSDGVRVAVKTVPKKRAIYVEMLRNEIEILRGLEGHANVIRLYDAFEDEKQVHFIFELCTGGELFDPIADPNFRFTERQASRLVRKLLDTVRHIHGESIIHRDLKPENMLLSQPGIDAELKVIDFGLASRVEPGEVLNKHVGTPYYIAPEVLEKRYSKEADLWSVGVITFTLLCGYPPFWGDTEREIYARIRRGTYAFDGPDWDRRSLYSKDLISKLLVMEPDQRISIEDALRHPWILHEGEVLDASTKRFLSKIRRYSQFPLLKKVALAILVQHLEPDAHAYLRESYQCFDTNETTGDIDLASLKASLRARAAASTEPEVDALIKALDLNKDGRVSYIEFAAAVMPRLHYLDHTRVYQLFNVMDIDSDGVITFQDLKRLMGEEGLAAQALQEADLDGDGKIEFADFFAVMGADEAYIL